MKNFILTTISLITLSIGGNTVRADNINFNPRDYSLTCPLKITIQQIKDLKAGKNFSITLLNRKVAIVFEGTRTLADVSIPLLPWKKREFENSIQLKNSQLNQNHTKIDCFYSYGKPTDAANVFIIYGLAHNL